MTFDPNQPRNKDGEWTDAANAARVGAGLPASSSLSEMYAGLPDAGGYGSGSEYEIGHKVYAEAGHCILGSLTKCYNSGFAPDRKAIEEGHIREELGIMKETVEEYSRNLYTRPDMLDSDSIKSIADAGKRLAQIVLKSRAGLGEIPAEYKQLAIKTLDAIHVMTLASILSDNVFKTSELRDATLQVEEAVNIFYPKDK